ncbi:hypothetical protein Q3G72_019626 [Acer saccharum]|nr:hypothetical protein Q3G72_019626 [Acer saccharum]
MALALWERVVEKELFRILKDKLGGIRNLHAFISEKVVAVPGEVSYDNLGVTDFNLSEEMWRNIDTILNISATTNFNERYDVALGTNTMGAFHVLNFAKKCVKIKMFLLVSTGPRGPVRMACQGAWAGSGPVRGGRVADQVRHVGGPRSVLQGDGPPDRPATARGSDGSQEAD